MRIRAGLVSSALLALSASALAQTPPMTGEFQVNSYTTSGQYVYGVAMDARGRFVVSWESGGQDGNGYAAIARLFDDSTTPITGDIQVNTFTTGYQSYPRVAMDGAGRFVVVWASYAQDGSDYAVRARRFDENGNALGGEIPVNTFTSGHQTSPHVASDRSGRFFVDWNSQGEDGSLDAAAGRLFDDSGNPVAADFVLNTYTTGNQEANDVAADGNGNFVVVWNSAEGSDFVTMANRYDGSGNPLGAPFQVNTTSNHTGFAKVQAARAGDFVVVWHGYVPGNGNLHVMGRRFDNAGNALGDEFTVSTDTTFDQNFPWIGMDSAGNFLVGWQGNDGGGIGVKARRYDRFGNPVSDEFLVNVTTAAAQMRPHVGANDRGDFVVSWHSGFQDGASFGVFARKSGMVTSGAEADAHAPTLATRSAAPAAPAGPLVSDTNGVLEPGETVVFQPTWENRSASALAVTGTATDFSGPAGPTYTLVQNAADYGTIGAASSADCFDATSICYVVTVSDPGAGSRPAQHWDAKLQEQLSAGTPKTWALHVGNSFADMPHNLFYPFVENLFHNGITGGCAGGGYCPGNDVTRAQMAVFLLKSKYSADYVPPPATGTVFADVPASNPFAPWIENLAALGITGGCGNGNYCPNSSVTRAQMAVFLLKTLLGAGYMPPACAGVFVDVPCPSLFADWIEDLYGRSITGGCNQSPPQYCPDNPNLRQQMAVFLVKTFGLKLYGP